MESKRVPKAGEVWSFNKRNTYANSLKIVSVAVDEAGVFGDCCGDKHPLAPNFHCHPISELLADASYVSGPSDAPAECEFPGCEISRDGIGPDAKVPRHGPCAKDCSSDEDKCCRNTIWCHDFVPATEARITQAAVADELEKRAKDIPSFGGSLPAVQNTEAARGGEAAVSRADTMGRMTSSDANGADWKGAPVGAHCRIGVACNVCVPPVKRVPWVDSLPVDWWLPDA